MLCRKAAALAAVLALGVFWTVSPAPADAGRSRRAGPLVPYRGAMFGTTVGLGDCPSLQQIEHDVGRRFAIAQHYYNWDEQFPTANETDDFNNGRIPMIGWVSAPLDEIVSGQDDSTITARAQDMKNFGHRIFLRWGYEMNGSWFPWAGSANQPNGPSKFVAAWRHIHDIFTSVGATTVVWVWAPNWQDQPFGSWNHWTHYYPGDAYVDWVGIDGFNWGSTQSWSKWTPISTMIAGLYSDYARRKPMMVAETASVEQGGDKAAWIAGARRVIEQRYPAIAAFIYYNDKDRNQPVYWCSNSSPAALSAFRSMGHDPFFDRLSRRRQS